MENMEKKDFLDKISQNSKCVKWLRTVGMEERIKKELEGDLERRRRSYDKIWNVGQKKIKMEKFNEDGYLEDLEKNRQIWKDFSVSGC